MNRMQFVLVTALVLFVAFALGWFTNWLIHRFTRVRQQDLGELDNMAQALHEAEEIRDQAITYVETRERDLTARIKQLEAEVDAAMAGVREARAEAEYYRGQMPGRHTAIAPCPFLREIGTWHPAPFRLTRHTSRANPSGFALDDSSENGG